jgi:4-amino-4-deoxy-L-arabinose transferase-like glycosyltransferase
MTGAVIPIGAVFLLMLATTGAGAIVLALLGLLDRLIRTEAAAWSFAVGFGTLGWLMFPLGTAGMLGVDVLLVLCAVFLPGLLLLARCAAGPERTLPGRAVLLLLPILLAVAFDLLEGLAPPADADSLAYHFALPRQFLNEGAIRFIARAVDGAVPLTVQMTYLPALAIGGERALTLWTMVTGWAAIALVYTLARRHLETGWSLALSALLLTTPAVVYGAGAGQIETRILLFTLTGGFATAWAMTTDRAGAWRWALLAGLCAGFFAGSKYTGLLFVAACGLILLATPAKPRDWAYRATAFAAGAALAGAPWYLWNAWHTGDPVFPMLYGLLAYHEGVPWGPLHADAFRDVMFSVERGVPPTLGWFLAYPLKATLDGLAQWESRRTGLGPAALLLLPLALTGLWKLRDRAIASPLLPLALIALLFYSLWFFLGTAQRIRHLLPVYPLLLLPVMVAAARWQTGPALARPWRNPVLGAIVLTLTLQIAGHGLFALSYMRHALDDENRDQFLARTVANHHPVVPWINESLEPEDKLLLSERQLVYLLNVPLFYGHPHFQAEIDARPQADDHQQFWRDARRLGITHVLFRGTVERSAGDTDGLRRQILRLIAAGCAAPIQVFSTRNYASRTLQTLADPDLQFTLAALTPNSCGLANHKGARLEPADAPYGDAG